MARLRHAALLLLALGGCKTSAPYAVNSAIINTALAVAVAGVSVAHGGCVSVCEPGRVCNPKTGFCDPSPEFRCVGGNLNSGLCANRPEDLTAAQPGSLPSSLSGSPVGISPATGTVPPPPAEASPRPP